MVVIKKEESPIKELINIKEDSEFLRLKQAYLLQYDEAVNKAFQIEKERLKSKYKKEFFIVNIEQERKPEPQKKIKEFEKEIKKNAYQFMARFSAEHYKDYVDYKIKQYQNYKARYDGEPETPYIDIYNTFIPKDFYEDLEFKDKSEISNVYVNDKLKMVVWSIKGIEFGLRGVNDIFDVGKISLLNPKYYASNSYYSLAVLIIEKYKARNSGYSLYWVGHSRGASLLLSLITTNWEEYQTLINTKNNELFLDENYPIDDFSKHITGLYAFAPGENPLAHLLPTKGWPQVKPDKKKRLNDIVDIILLSGDIISFGSTYPYGTTLYTDKSFFPFQHSIMEFLPKYIKELQPYTISEGIDKARPNIIYEPSSLITELELEINFEFNNALNQPNLINSNNIISNNNIDMKKSTRSQLTDAQKKYYNEGKNAFKGVGQKMIINPETLKANPYFKMGFDDAVQDAKQTVKRYTSQFMEVPADPSKQIVLYKDMTQPKRTEPISKPKKEESTQTMNLNPYATIENKVKSTFTGEAIPQFIPRVKQESKISEFKINKDTGAIESTFGIGKDKPQSLTRLKAKKIDVHKGNKLDAPLLPQPSTKSTVSQSKFKKEKDMKEPVVKKITSNKKIPTFK